MNQKRKEAHSEHDGQRLMGDFVKREPTRVEIIDDDEIEEINSEELRHTPCSNRSMRFIRRQKRSEHKSGRVVAEDEDWELQEALRMSRMEAKVQEERRRMHGNPQDVMKLQVEIQPIEYSVSPSNRIKGPNSTGQPSGEEKEREASISPELFSTPPENLNDECEATAKVESDEEVPDSPALPVTNRASAVKQKVPEEMENINQLFASALREDKDPAKRKLKLRRTKDHQLKRERRQHEPKVTFVESDKESQVAGTENSKELVVTVVDQLSSRGKRKLEVNNDDDDATDDDEHFEVVKGNWKRKKVSVVSDDSDTEESVTDKRGLKRALERFDNASPKTGVGIAPDQPTRMESLVTSRGKKDSPALGDVTEPRSPVLSLRLTRRYKKLCRRPTSLKQAMKARFYFAPPGFDVPTYTLLIIKMFEKYRKRLHAAQSKVKTRIPWGNPVKAGSRQGDTLDSRTSTGSTRNMGRATTGGEKDTAVVKGTPRVSTTIQVKSYPQAVTFVRKRTLRSSVASNVRTTIPSKMTRSSEPLNVDSESDDDLDLKSYLNEDSKLADKTPTNLQTDGSMAQNPRNAVMEFGANVVLSPGTSELQSNKTVVLRSNLLSFDEPSKSGELSTSVHTVSAQEISDIADREEVKLTDSPVETFRPPKRRSVLRILEDDTTEDESDESQPSFSFRQSSREKKESGDGVSKRVASSAEEMNIEETVPGDSDGDTLSLEQGDVCDSPAILQLADQDSHIEFKKDPQTLVGDECLAQDSPSETTLVDREQISPSTTVTSNAKQTSSSVSRDTTMEEHQKVIDGKVSSDGENSGQGMQRKRSDVAERAAAAAEWRQRVMLGLTTEESCSSSSTAWESLPQQEEVCVVAKQEYKVECPLCYCHFSSKDIESHASDCQGQFVAPEASSFMKDATIRAEFAGSSVTSKQAKRHALTGIYKKERDIKDLRVVIQRSPIADQKLRQKASEYALGTAKRNLGFVQNLGSSQSSPRSDKQTESEVEGTVSRLEKMGSNKDNQEEGSSQNCSRNNLSSPEKKRSRWTYNQSSRENSSKSFDFLGDYIPLNSQECDESDDSAVKQPKKAHRSRAISVESEDNSGSDTEMLMTHYGAARADEQSKEAARADKQSKEAARADKQSKEAARADKQRKEAVARADKQSKGATRADKQRKEAVARADKRSEDIDHESDENERALLQLGQRNKKRPLSTSKLSRAKKSCVQRGSDSDDSDDSFILCELCNKKLPKVDYAQHVDEELAERAKMEHVPRKLEVVLVNDQRGAIGKAVQGRVETRGKKNPCVPTQSSKTAATEIEQENEEFDWEDVSNSPIKCFQFTGNTDSAVDFDNQFAHLVENKDRTRQPRSTGNRGKQWGYRGSYGGGARYRKYRGTRQKKM